VAAEHVVTFLVEHVDCDHNCREASGWPAWREEAVLFMFSMSSQDQNDFVSVECFDAAIALSLKALNDTRRHQALLGAAAGDVDAPSSWR
jgi:hypothetical protein